MNGLVVARQPQQQEPALGGAETGEGGVKHTVPVVSTPHQPLADAILSAGGPAPSDVQRQVHEKAGQEFQGKLKPDEVEREVGPSIWAAIAAGAYRFAGTPYSPSGSRTLGLDMGQDTVPNVLNAPPEIKLGDNTAPVSVSFAVKDDEKIFVDEARIVAVDGKKILDRAKPTTVAGEFAFGGSDKQYPEGSFLVYKLSDGTSYHMPLRPEVPPPPVP